MSLERDLSAVPFWFFLASLAVQFLILSVFICVYLWFHCFS
jgi:hypothetical protein